MAQQINITYYKDATVKCVNCGSNYTMGSTLKEISVEVCGNCHPFYTGQDTILDTTGRIEKFQARLQKVQTETGKVRKVKARKIMQNIGDLETTPQA